MPRTHRRPEGIAPEGARDWVHRPIAVGRPAADDPDMSPSAAPLQALAAQLRDLADLRRAGVLTAAEFRSAKARVLAQAFGPRAILRG
jgi:hypothetical protein